MKGDHGDHAMLPAQPIKGDFGEHAIVPVQLLEGEFGDHVIGPDQPVKALRKFMMRNVLLQMKAGWHSIFLED
jgi:hypothetical protein